MKTQISEMTEKFQANQFENIHHIQQYLKKIFLLDKQLDNTTKSKNILDDIGGMLLEKIEDLQYFNSQDDFVICEFIEDIWAYENKLTIQSQFHKLINLIILITFLIAQFCYSFL